MPVPFNRTGDSEKRQKTGKSDALNTTVMVIGPTGKKRFVKIPKGA